MVEPEKEKWRAWERAPGETYEDYKKRFSTLTRKHLKSEYKKDERKIEKVMRFRAWDQMPGESAKDFKRRLKAETRGTNS